MVSVVIASYNQIRTLPLSLESFAVQTVLPSMVIIADDGSCDGTPEWVDSLPDDAYPFPVRYTTGRHNGYGLTVSENRAASKVSGGRLLFTNADVVHNPTSVEAHGSMSDNFIAGGRICEIAEPYSHEIAPVDLDPFDVFLDEYGCHLSDLSNSGYVSNSPRENFYGIWGGNLSIDAWRFKILGGFDEEYRGKYGGEEADMIQRFFTMGGDVAWAYSSTAYHLAHSSKIYRGRADGNTKYREDYAATDNHLESRTQRTTTNRKRFQNNP